MPVTGKPRHQNWCPIDTYYEIQRQTKKKLTRNDVAITLFVATFFEVGKVDINVPTSTLVLALYRFPASPKLVGIMIVVIKMIMGMRWKKKWEEDRRWRHKHFWFSSGIRRIQLWFVFPTSHFLTPKTQSPLKKITFKIFLWVWSWLKFYLQQPGTLSPSIWQPVPSSSSVFDPLAQLRSLFYCSQFFTFLQYYHLSLF